MSNGNGINKLSDLVGKKIKSVETVGRAERITFTFDDGSSVKIDTSTDGLEVTTKDTRTRTVEETKDFEVELK